MLANATPRRLQQPALELQALPPHTISKTRAHSSVHRHNYLQAHHKPQLRLLASHRPSRASISRTRSHLCLFRDPHPPSRPRRTPRASQLLHAQTRSQQASRRPRACESPLTMALLCVPCELFHALRSRMYRSLHSPPTTSSTLLQHLSSAMLRQNTSPSSSPVTSLSSQTWSARQSSGSFTAMSSSLCLLSSGTLLSGFPLQHNRHHGIRSLSSKSMAKLSW
jgi:hypothetical protein